MALLLLAPLLVAMVALVRVLQGRPVLFAQQRTGFDSKIFVYHRLRTSSLDELRQLYNVLYRDMSLVGRSAVWGTPERATCLEPHVLSVGNALMRPLCAMLAKGKPLPPKALLSITVRTNGVPPGTRAIFSKRLTFTTPV